MAECLKSVPQCPCSARGLRRWNSLSSIEQANPQKFGTLVREVERTLKIEADSIYPGSLSVKFDGTNDSDDVRETPALFRWDSGGDKKFCHHDGWRLAASARACQHSAHPNIAACTRAASPHTAAPPQAMDVDGLMQDLKENCKDGQIIFKKSWVEKHEAFFEQCAQLPAGRCDAEPCVRRPTLD